MIIIRGGFHRGQDVLELIESLSIDDEITFELEPDNAYDANAVKAVYNGVHIGYVAREQAPWICDACAQDPATRAAYRGHNGRHPFFELLT